MSFSHAVLYTIYCDSDYCYYMPKSRLNCWVANKELAHAAAVKAGWTVKRNLLDARCPKCKEREGK